MLKKQILMNVIVNGVELIIVDIGIYLFKVVKNVSGRCEAI